MTGNDIREGVGFWILFLNHKTDSYVAWDKSKDPYSLRNHIIPNYAIVRAQVNIFEFVTCLDAKHV